MQLVSASLKADTLYRFGLVNASLHDLASVTKRAEEIFNTSTSGFDRKVLNGAFELEALSRAMLAAENPEQLKQLRELNQRYSRLDGSHKAQNETTRHALLFHELFGAMNAGAYLRAGDAARKEIKKMSAEERGRFDSTIGPALSSLGVNPESLMGGAGLEAFTSSALTWQARAPMSVFLATGVISAVGAVPTAPLVGGNPAVSGAIIYNGLRAAETIFSDGDKILDASISGVAPPQSKLEKGLSVLFLALDLLPIAGPALNYRPLTGVAQQGAALPQLERLLLPPLVKP